MALGAIEAQYYNFIGKGGGKVEVSRMVCLRTRMYLARAGFPPGARFNGKNALALGIDMSKPFCSSEVSRPGLNNTRTHSAGEFVFICAFLACILKGIGASVSIKGIVRL
jgi:hypothetical protein